MDNNLNLISKICSSTSLVLEGTSGCGKTTILKLLEQNGRIIGYYDYCEDLQTGDSDVVMKSTNYMFLYGLRKLCTQLEHMKTFPNKQFVYDRSFLASYCYSIIFDSSKWVYNVDSGVEELVDFKLPKEILLYMKKLGDIIIFIAGDPEYTLQLMNKRANGIDILTVDYILRQNIIFTRLADLLGAPKIIIDVDISREELYKQIKNFVELEEEEE